LLIRRSQAARMALARRVDRMTERALKGLGTPAESQFVLVNDSDKKIDVNDFCVKLKGSYFVSFRCSVR